MTNPESLQSDIGDWRARLAELAAQDAAAGEAAAAAVEARARELRQAAAVTIEAAAAVVRDLPPQTPETLGPLWPGNNQ